MYKGISGSKGIGIGKAVIIEEKEIVIDEKTVSDVDAEIARMKDAFEVFVQETNEMADNMEKTVGAKDADILRGHIMLLEDPTIKSQMEEMVSKDKVTAEKAVDEVFEQTAKIFEQIPDELLQQRAADFRDIKLRVIKILLGISHHDMATLPKGTVVIAKDLTPSMTAGIVPENIAGIITEIGGPTSHSAILARAMEIPAVLSVENIVSIASNDDKVILDGTTGEVFINPEDDVVLEYEKKFEKFQKGKELLKEYKGKEALTACGKKVELVCNIGKPEDAKKALECDGEGIGLFRTEFLFMDRDSMPTEDEQFEAYKEAATTMSGKPVIIRTLDIGGDKKIEYLGLEKEDNPFLGFRAIRFCLNRTDIYKTQLRAILRASAYGDIRIMVPLVTGVDELRQVKILVNEIKTELDNEKIAYNNEIKIGVMMETPAACVMADVLAKEADFFSIGTNDLTGYTMAVDRGNAKVAYLYSAYNPAVLRSIQRIISCGKKEGIMVGMCGEAAADEKLIPLLLGFGLDEFSVSATSVLNTRKAIAACNMDKCRELVTKVMECATEQDVKSLLQ